MHRLCIDRRRHSSGGEPKERFMIMDLGSAFAVSVARQPGQIAIVEGDRRVSYSDWYCEIKAVGGALRDMGLKPGDHFVVVMRNRYEMATLYWACHMLGVIFTPVSWRASADEIKYCIEDAEAVVVAFDGASGDAAAQAIATLKIDPRRVIVVADGKGEGRAFAELLTATPIAGPAGVDEFSICLMLYTSGTTGRPKGVPRSHRNEMTASTAHISQNQYRQGDSCLGVMPFFHTMGVRILLGMALLNGRLVCLPAYQPEEVLRLVAAEKLTTLYLVPTMFHDVLRHPKFADYDLSSLSRVGYAGMTMAPALVERCLEQLKPELFVNYYGSSEIFASMNSPEAFKGYWKRPDADAKSIQGRWYRTGDLGKIDEDGELFVVGRVDDMIISGGENIFPEEVEDTLIRSKLVAGVAVVGMPDDRLGTKVVAFIEPAVAGLGPEQLDEVCLQSELARFKRPKEYVLVKAIPRSASGKLLRRMLRSGEYEPFEPIKSTVKESS